MPPLPQHLKLSRRMVLSAAPAGALAAPAALAQQAPAAPPARLEDMLQQFDRLAQDIMRRSGIPGMSIAVVHRDRLVYIKSFGVREAGKPAPVDPDTVFQLASVSKPIAATVIAALVGDGTVGWDDPVVRHDPGFEMHDPWVTREVTLRDMLAHRSGLPDHAGDMLEDLGYDRGQVLHRLRYQKPDSGFRARYAYTNFGFTEAAVAAASAAGNSWEDLSAERLYRPLGMAHASSRFADFTAAANRVRGHVRIGGEWVAKYTRDPDAQSPAGGVSASVRDMASWLRLQLAAGKFAGKQIIDAAALAETHRPQIVRSPAKNPAIDHSGFYGLGWNIDYDPEGRVHWSHSGGFDLGAATSVSLLPAKELGIVALTNAQPIGVPEAVAKSLFDLALYGKVEKDWLTLYGELMTTVLAPGYTAIDYAKMPGQPSPALPAAAYRGTYENALYGPADVVDGDAGLVLKLGPRHRPYLLRHVDRDVFGYQPEGENAAGPSAVRFTIGIDRRAEAVTIDNLDTNGQGTFRRAPTTEIRTDHG
ncbi:MAG TPA: serine hydrolase [Stellaceae bacterium]|nr:serine hydrolase [Stellaceae bacterium]